jgi:hypothetical protein
MMRFSKPALTPDDLARALQIIQDRIDKDDRQAAITLLGSSGEILLLSLQNFILQIAQRGTGGRCFCCGGHVQVQYRIINKAMARVIVEMCFYYAQRGLKPGIDFIKPERVLRSASKCREQPRFRHWGAMLGRPANPKARGIRGIRWVEWTALQSAFAYANGKAKWHRWAIVLHDELIRLAGPLQSIREVEGFDIDEYMGEVSQRWQKS